jgi:hypothetical protein
MYRRKPNPTHVGRIPTGPVVYQSEADTVEYSHAVHLDVTAQDIGKLVFIAITAASPEPPEIISNN